MITAAIILILLFVICLVVWFTSSSEAIGMLAAMFGFLGFLALVLSISFRVGSQELTGYIYSSTNKVGYTTAHIRFSQNAGTDAQPEFCVKTDSDAGRQVQKYVGSDTKVKVAIPSYFYFANNPFACGTTKMTIQEVK